MNKKDKKIKSNYVCVPKIPNLKPIFDDFIIELKEGKFKNNEEVIAALQKIEPSYKPYVYKEKNLLRANGNPYRKRISIAIAVIYNIKTSQSISWETIGKHYWGENSN